MYRVDDVVEWTSQSSSYRKTKKGTIVAVVPAGKNPDGFIPPGMRCGSPSGFGMARDHVSYLVKVEGKGNGLYWPRVSHLQCTEAREEFDDIFLEHCVCGKLPRVVRVKGRYQVSCDNCLDTIRFDTPQEAADHWNEMHSKSRERKRYLEAKEVAQVLLDFVNALGNKNADVIEEVYLGHRTLQQGVTRFCVEWLARCAKMHDEHDFDLRNQASCELGKEFMKIPPEKRALPLI